MMTPEQDRETTAIFRRRRFAVTHRRRRLWIRLLKPLAAAVLIVGIPAGGAWWTMTSPVFRVGDVAVAAGERVSEGWGQEQLGQLRGRHILLLELDEVEALLAGHPWFRGVEMSKRLPSRLEVKILEREAAALLRVGGDLHYLDGGGAMIAPYRGGSDDGDFVLISASVGDREALRRALGIVTRWSRVAGPWAGGLSEVEILDSTSFRLHVADLEFPLLVNHDRLESGIIALREHLPAVARRLPALEMADLRFSGQIVFQPAEEPPTEG